MRARRLSAGLLCLVVAAVEIFGFLPSLHACVRQSAALAATAAMVATSAATTALGPGGDPDGGASPATAPDPARSRRQPVGARQIAPAAEDCPACRVLGMVIATRWEQPMAAPALRPSPAPMEAPAPCHSVRLDRACGRAPPLA